MKKTVKVILGIVAALMTAITGILLYCYHLAFRRDEKRVSKEGAVPEGEQYEVFSDVIIKGANNILNAPYEKVMTTSRDGITLAGRYYHVKDGAPVSIIFHGYRSNIGTDCNGGYYLSVKNGYNVLVVYQRAHRESGGKTITFGVKERFDCLDWIAYVNERFGENTPIFLMGLSMGAATVLMAAGLDLPSNVKGIMADCGFSSPKEILNGLAISSCIILGIKRGGMVRYLAASPVCAAISVATASATVWALKTICAVRPTENY